jgi:hypothetical protein
MVLSPLVLLGLAVFVVIVLLIWRGRRGGI